MRWDIVQGSFGFGIKSVRHNEYVYVGNPMHDDIRRYVLVFTSGSPATDNDMRFDMIEYEKDLQSMKFHKAKLVGSPRLLSCHEETQKNLKGSMPIYSTYHWQRGKKKSKSTTNSWNFSVNASANAYYASGPVCGSVHADMHFDVSSSCKVSAQEEVGEKCIQKVACAAGVQQKFIAKIYEQEIEVKYTAYFTDGTSAGGVWRGIMQTHAEVETLPL